MDGCRSAEKPSSAAPGSLGGRAAPPTSPRSGDGPPADGPPLTAPPPELAGRSEVAALRPGDPSELAGYRVVGRLGEGGMGTVYLGRTPEGRLVAIKVIRADIAAVPAFRARFRREAEVGRRVARFCTAELLDAVDPPDGQPFIVTEFIDGPTLAEAVSTGGPLGAADLERVAVSVAAALTAIHGAGLVHRDLKPSNVLLSSFGPRVIDFGIAYAADSTRVTQDSIVGTPAFMAPEQIRADGITSAADIWAWGGLVVFAGTGHPPFGAGPAASQLFRIMQTDPDLEGLGPALGAVVRQAMSRDPRARPTADELLRRLVTLGAAVPPPAGAAQDSAAQDSAAQAGSPATVGPDLTALERLVTDAALPGLQELLEPSQVPDPRAVPPHPESAAPRPERSAPAEATPPVRRAFASTRVLVAVALGVLVTLLGAWLVVQADGHDRTAAGTSRQTDTTVPDDLIGLPFHEAATRLRAAGFRAIREETRADAHPRDSVLSVNPVSGSRADASTTVTLVVSTGPTNAQVTIPQVVTPGAGPDDQDDPTTIPDIVGRGADAAEQELRTAGFTNITRSYRPADQPADIVLAVDPTSGTRASRNAALRIDVSTGPGHTTITNVVGWSEVDARSSLETAGLTVVTRTDSGPSGVGPGLVAKVQPPGNTQVAYGTTVTITVVSRQVTVPDVVGQDRATATETLRGLGLDVVEEPRPGSEAPGTVVSQQPRGGVVARGTAITIIVAQAQAPDHTPASTPPASPS